jgi:hypothetical protein
MKVISWLKHEQNWDFLKGHDNDCFQIKEKNISQQDYILALEKDVKWGDWISLQAFVQAYHLPVHVVSSMSSSFYSTQFQVNYFLLNFDFSFRLCKLFQSFLMVLTDQFKKNVKLYSNVLMELK